MCLPYRFNRLIFILLLMIPVYYYYYSGTTAKVLMFNLSGERNAEPLLENIMV